MTSQNSRGQLSEADVLDAMLRTLSRGTQAR